MKHLYNTKKDYYSVQKYLSQWGMWQCLYCGEKQELHNVSAKRKDSCGCYRGYKSYYGGGLKVCRLFYDVIVSMAQPDNHNEHINCAYWAVQIWRDYDCRNN